MAKKQDYEQALNRLIESGQIEDRDNKIYIAGTNIEYLPPNERNTEYLHSISNGDKLNNVGLVANNQHVGININNGLSANFYLTNIDNPLKMSGLTRGNTELKEAEQYLGIEVTLFIPVTFDQAKIIETDLMIDAMINHNYDLTSKLGGNNCLSYAVEKFNDIGIDVLDILDLKDRNIFQPIFPQDIVNNIRKIETKGVSNYHINLTSDGADYSFDFFKVGEFIIVDANDSRQRAIDNYEVMQWESNNHNYSYKSDLNNRLSNRVSHHNNKSSNVTLEVFSPSITSIMRIAEFTGLEIFGEHVLYNNRLITENDKVDLDVSL